jgi:hypothetical protein
MRPSSSGAHVAPFHEQILRTALLPVDRTRDEWAAIARRADDLWTPGAEQLLPLLSRALVNAGIEDPVVAQLMQTGRHAWVENQLTFERLGAALEILQRADIRTMTLKGVPLALTCYPDSSLRPMIDFDLLVGPERAADAADALEQAGWTAEGDLVTDFTARTPEVPFRSPDGRAVLDLHWRLVPWVGRSWTADDPALWRDATSLMIEDHTTLAPARHDLLLHVILHAFRSGWARVPRWVADVVVLLRSSSGSFDWDHFVRRVLGGHLALPVTSALGYVASRLDAPVPDDVLRRLAGARTTHRERHMHRCAERDIVAARHWLLGEATALRIGWARSSVNYSRIGAFSSFPHFLRGRAHVDRLGTLPFVIAQRRIAAMRASRSRTRVAQ